MSIATEIERITKASADIKASIKAKGVNIPEDTRIDGYAHLIGEISSGDASGSEVSDEILNREITEIHNESVTDLGSYALAGSYSLVSAEFPNVTTLYSSAFYRCTKLTSISFPKLKAIKTDAFNSCSTLTKADFPVIEEVGQNAFSGCVALSTLILRANKCATLGSNALFNTPISKGTGYVYVPSALVEEYKAASNWSTYSAQFRVIEEYPEITGG
jgi:hypothetical protein